MTNEEILARIKSEIKLLSTIIQDTKPSDLDNLHVDSIKSKLRNIYNDLITIDKTDFKIESKPEIVEPIIPKKEDTLQEAISTPKIEVEKKVIAEKKEPKLQASEESQERSITDKYAKNNQSVNDIIALKNMMNVSSKIQNSPISDIVAAIGINDKFLYMRDLFSNDKDLYTKTVKRLNEAGNLDIAYTIITTEFAWDFENPTVQQFISLVHRKYANLK